MRILSVEGCSLGARQLLHEARVDVVEQRIHLDAPLGERAADRLVLRQAHILLLCIADAQKTRRIARVGQLRRVLLAGLDHVAEVLGEVWAVALELGHLAADTRVNAAAVGVATQHDAAHAEHVDGKF